MYRVKLSSFHDYFHSIIYIPTVLGVLLFTDDLFTWKAEKQKEKEKYPLQIYCITWKAEFQREWGRKREEIFRFGSLPKWPQQLRRGQFKLGSLESIVSPSWMAGFHRCFSRELNGKYEQSGLGHVLEWKPALQTVA